MRGRLIAAELIQCGHFVWLVDCLRSGQYFIDSIAQGAFTDSQYSINNIHIYIINVIIRPMDWDIKHHQPGSALAYHPP